MSSTSSYVIRYVRTTPTIEKCSFPWKLEKISLFGDFRALVSPSFSSVNGLCSWNLELILLSDSANTTFHFDLIPKFSEAIDQLRVSFNASLTDSNGLDIGSTSFDTAIFKDGWRGAALIPRNKLRNLPGDLLTIHIDVTAFLPMVTTVVPEIEPPTITCVGTILLDIRKFSDFIIRIGDTDIPVHKCVLASRSPVLEAMLQHSNTSEVQLGLVELKDLKLETALAMVNFFYVGKVDNLNSELAMDLLRAADKYDIRELLKLCSSHLQLHLSVSNVIEIYEAAVHSNALELKECCVKFIDENSQVTDMGKKLDGIFQRRNVVA